MKKGTILIVEDSYIVAFHLKTTLESEGYQVISTIDSGEGALLFLQNQRPDLVLMDIMLNGKMDGVETARIIRSDYNIPIIYITALTDRNTIQRAKITEPYGYLTKPFEDREIFTVIEMALYKHNIESKLKASEEKYFSTLRSISDAVVVIDQDFCITYMNPAAEEMLGAGLPELNLKNFLNELTFIKAGDDGEPVNPLQCELNGAKSNAVPRDVILVSKKGVRRYVGEGSMSPWVNIKGQGSGLVLILKDLTLKVEHERLLHSFEYERLSAIMEGQEKERLRIAKDLHDGLGQMLTAIKLNLERGIPEEKQAVLRKLIDEAVQESVRISENLAPSNLNDFDLQTCINSLCQQMYTGYGCKIHFELLGDPHDMDHHQKVNLFRIAQEAINNALKHADAKLISVQLTYNDQSTVLTVEDDGRGFSYSGQDHGRGFGLGNMRDRAGIMGGKFFLESDMNRGTLIIVEVPAIPNHVTL